MSWLRMKAPGLLLGAMLAMLTVGCRHVAIRASPDEVQTVILRGRVICLPEEMHRLHGAALPTQHEHVWAFRTADGHVYVLLRGHFSEAIWLDSRVRARELELKARSFPATQCLEVERLRSVKDGVVQDLYYYCDICHIEAVSLEPCSCCQGPVQLVEKPLSESHRD